MFKLTFVHNGKMAKSPGAKGKRRDLHSSDMNDARIELKKLGLSIGKHGVIIVKPKVIEMVAAA